MEILTFPLNTMQTNCYLLIHEKEALAIDVSGDPAPLLRELDQREVTLKAILLTHLHFDHTMGVNALAQAKGVPVYGSSDDLWMLEDPLGKGGMWGIPDVESYTVTPFPDEQMDLIHVPFLLLKTPGHTPGGVCFYFASEKALFSGDTLFYRSVGRTDFPRGNTATLFSSIKETLFALPDDTIVYPGHGQTTTLGGEKTHNAFLQ